MKERQSSHETCTRVAIAALEDTEADIAAEGFEEGHGPDPPVNALAAPREDRGGGIALQ